MPLSNFCKLVERPKQCRVLHALDLISCALCVLLVFESVYSILYLSMNGAYFAQMNIKNGNILMNVNDLKQGYLTFDPK